MRSLSRPSWIAPLALLAARAEAQARPEERFAALDGIVAAAQARTGAPGVALAVVEGGTLLLARGYGRASVEGEAAVTPDTLFQIGSVTKPFTAAALLAAVGEGELALDAPVGSAVSGLAPELARLTLAQLLSHTAGLIDEPDEFGPQGEEGLAAYPRTWTAEYVLLPPGRAFSYSNSGFALAGLALQEREGRPFAEILRARVLAPLGMTRTTFRPTEAMTWPLALGHRRKDGVVEVVRPLANDARLWPAGTLYSSARELASFLSALAAGGELGGKAALPAAVVRAMLEPRAEVPALGNRYGFGLWLDTYRGQARAGHGGGMTGYGALLGVLLERRIGVVVLANGDGALLGDVADAALDLALGLAPGSPEAAAPEPAPVALTAAELEACVGHYVNPRRFAFDVERRGEGLVLLRFGSELALRPLGEQRFRLEPAPGRTETIAFGLGPDGRAAYAHMNVWAFARAPAGR